jgi:hypothetical protein
MDARLHGADRDTIGQRRHPFIVQNMLQRNNSGWPACPQQSFDLGHKRIASS